MTPNAAERLVLVDGSAEAVPVGRCVAYWSERQTPSGAKSVPATVDEIAGDLREEYCKWSHDIGARLVHGRPVRAHLAFWPDFSFWWMGLIAEKEPLKSPGIYTVFKLRALERLYVQQECRGILYVGTNPRLHRTLRAWARAMGHSYQRVRAEQATARGDSRHPLLTKLPWLVQGFGYLLLKCWSQYRPALRRRAAAALGPSQATIITYFPNVDLKRTSAGRFWSRYWEQLHDLLDELPGPITWLWLYVDSEKISYPDAVRLRDVCNAGRPHRYRHFLLDEFASPRVVLRAARTYLRSSFAALRLRGARDGFRMPDSDLNFFAMLSHDWHSSLCGIAAMDGALTIELFDAAAAALGPAIWTLYVWENQPWEAAAITAWRRHGNGRIIGVQHATLPPLDLRAFVDSRELEGPRAERRPSPDLLAVNGAGARDLASRTGLPQDRIVMTEALRYLHLQAPPKHDEAPSTLLVITGIKRSEAIRQLTLLDEAARAGALAKYDRVLIKPHPFCAIEPLLAENGLSLPGQIVRQPLSVLLAEADAAFVANSTSAVAEALCLGIPSAVCGPADEMNLSPAFGCPEVPMISTAADLAAFLRAPSQAPWPADYLIVERSLPRWRRLLVG